MFVRRSIPNILVLIVAVTLVGCKKEESTEPPGGAQGDKPADTKPADETPEAACNRMLERFGADVIEVELEGCVAAITDGTEIGVCRDAGADVEKDYKSCFGQCMDSVAFDAATYSPGDSSTSPVANCVGGCFQNTCQ